MYIHTCIVIHTYSIHINHVHSYIYIHSYTLNSKENGSNKIGCGHKMGESYRHHVGFKNHKSMLRAQFHLYKVQNRQMEWLCRGLQKELCLLRAARMRYLKAGQWPERPGSILSLGMDVVGGFLYVWHIHSFEMSKNKKLCPPHLHPGMLREGGIWEMVRLTGGGLPWWSSGKESACQCRRLGFYS